MSQKPRDGAENWRPNEPLPFSFSQQDQAAFQKRIDSAVGTRDGRPLVRLAWAPAEKRWYPHPHGTEPPGYTFPIFHAYTNADGELVAAPRWVLLGRIEPEQYAPAWEATRYSFDDGRLWDWKGPCPSERYVELWCHAYHDGLCCPCIKYGICDCGEQYAHCWGRYLDPNERLLQWIAERAFESRSDPDVNPTADARMFTAPNAQRDLATELSRRQERAREERLRFSTAMFSHWERKPHSTIGSGVILTDSVN